MKNIRIFILSLSLILLFGLIVKTNAATAVPVTLTIGQGTVSCSNSVNGGALGSVTASFNSQNKTGYFTASSWTCTDTKGAAWSPAGHSVVATTITGSAGVNIPNTNIYMMVTGYSTTAGNLTGTSAMTTRQALSTSVNVYAKSATFSTGLGTYVSTPNLYLVIPANTPVGLYTGSITVTDPS